MAPADVIALQHAVGNRAVSQMLQRARLEPAESSPSATSPPLLLRALDKSLEDKPKAVMKDALNLVSPKLAGEKQLEGCLDGKKSDYVRPGQKGSHVTKVQEALIDLGITIGTPLGTYNTATVKAVKEFQSKAGLSGKDVDGIVGKRTIALLDSASRRHVVTADVDKKETDFKVEGKYEDAATEPDKVYFDRAGAALDADESAKVEKFAAAHKTSEMTLEGFACEEGSDAVNLKLIGERINTVKGILGKAGIKESKIHTLKNVTRSRGEIKYRKYRRVELKTGHQTKPTEKKARCEKYVTEACPADRTKDVRGAAKRAQQLVATAQKRLPPKGKDIAFFDKLYGTDKANRKDTADKLSNMSTEIIRHIGTLPDKSRHFCGKECHSGCQAGWVAYNTDKADPSKPDAENPSGVMTMCPVFFTKDLELQALILVHEGHHGTPGFHSKDYAYHHERLIFMLDPETALKNAASFHLFVLKMGGSKAKEAEPNITQVGPPGKDVHSEELKKDPKKKASLDQAVAWIEHWIKFVDAAVSHAFSATEEAQRKKRWPTKAGEPNRSGTLIMENFIADRFKLKKPPAIPSETDQAALAAIFDRLQQMAVPFKKGLSFSVGKSEWKRGTKAPGAEVSVAREFFSLKPSQQTTLLLQELVHATPDISAALEPEYVSFVEEISQEGYEFIGPQK